MWKGFVVLISLCALCLPCACAADSSLIGLAPADSNLLVGLNIEHIRQNPVGQLILSRLMQDDPRFKDFGKQAGFDPVRDVSQIVLTFPAKSEKTSGVALVGGSFDSTRFAELAVDPGVVTEAYHGIQIVMRQTRQQPVAAAMPDPSLIVIGDPASVRAFLDERTKQDRPVSPLAAKAAEMSQASDVWLVSGASPAGFAEPNSNLASGSAAELLQSIQEMSAGLKVGTQPVLSGRIVARSPKDAENLASALRTFLALAIMGRRTSSEAVPPPPKLKLETAETAIMLSMPFTEFEASNVVRVTADSLAIPRPKPKPKPTGVVVFGSPKDMGVTKVPPPK
jgi:hypothetical protein